MKNNLFPAIRLTIICVLFFSGIYTLLIYGVAQVVPGKGQGDKIIVDGKYYYSNIGQKFTSDSFFYSRPSAIDYNAMGSGAYNKSPLNPDYLTQVQARVDTFLVHNPGVQISDIPCDLVEASGSGLDPNISVQAAQIQVQRIAKKRSIAEPILQQLILSYTEKPWLGLFGTEKVNVVKLNVALGQIQE